MMRKRQGTLIYSEKTGRFNIRFDLNDYYGGLHCGECMDVMIDGRWKPTRIEYADDWYLVGVVTESLEGLIVQI